MSLDEVPVASTSSLLEHERPTAAQEAEERAAKRPRLDDGNLEQPRTVSLAQEELFRTEGQAQKQGQTHETAGATPPEPIAGSPSATFPRHDLLYTLSGHKKSISSIKFSADGRWMVSASADAPIHLHSLPSFHLHRVFHSHTSGVNDVAFSGDSTLLASSSDDRTVRIWEVDPSLSGQPSVVPPQPSADAMAADQKPEEAARVLRGHLSAVFCVSWSPRGDVVASGGMDETVRLWDVQRGKILRVLPAHSEPVSSVQFSRDGTMLVSGSWDGYIRIWDTSTGQCLKTLVNEDNAPVASVRFTPNSNFLFTSTLDSAIRLWDYQTDKVVKAYTGHTNRKYCIPAALTPDGRFLLTGSEDQKVFVFDIQSRQVVHSFHAHKDIPIAVAYHPSIGMFATGALEKDAVVKVWVTSDARTSFEVDGQRNGAPQANGMQIEPQNPS